ncbi:hypothetical protein HDU98_006493, partial [Podochytrium sp. JEL0797]
MARTARQRTLHKKRRAQVLRTVLSAYQKVVEKLDPPSFRRETQNPLEMIKDDLVACEKNTRQKWLPITTE